MKVTIELDKKLTDGELLIYKNGKIHSIEIHELLPELKLMKEDIQLLQKSDDNHETHLDNLDHRDIFIAKSLYDNYVERGIIDENEEFDAKFSEFVFNNSDLRIEDCDEDYKKILNRVRAQYGKKENN